MESLLFALNLIILIGFCRYALAKDDAERQSAAQDSAETAKNNNQPEGRRDA